jgi:O-antigen/teichoic acid export membrane protein
MVGRTAPRLHAMSGPLARLRAHARVPLYRNAYALMLSGAGSSALGMLFWIVASRSFDPYDVGIGSATISALTFVSAVGGLYLDGVLYRFVPSAGHTTPRLVRVAYAVTAAAAATAAAIFLAGVDVWTPDLEFLASSPWWVAASILGAVVSSVMLIQDGALIGMRRAFWVPVENLGAAVGRLALVVFLAAAGAQHAIIASWIAPSVLVALPVCLLVHRRFVPYHARLTESRRERFSRPEVVHYAAGNYAGFLCVQAYRTLPPLIVLHVLGSSENAFFYFPWLIMASLTLLTSNISVSLVVEAASDREALRIHARRAVVHTARLLVPIVAGLVLAAPFVLRLFGERYAEEGTTLLRLLALGLLPSALCVLSFGVARVQNHVRSIILHQVVLAGLVLGLTYALVDTSGIEGGGVAWLVSQTAVALLLVRQELWPVVRPAPQTPRPALVTETNTDGGD